MRLTPPTPNYPSNLFILLWTRRVLMAAVITSSKFLFLSNYHFLTQNKPPMTSPPIFFSYPFFLFFFFAFSLSFSLSIFFLCRNLKRQQNTKTHGDPSVIKPSLSKFIDGDVKTSQINPTRFSHSLLLDILPSGLYRGDQDITGSVNGDERDGSGDDSQRVKKKKKRAKKKRLLDSKGEENGGEEREREGSGTGTGRAKTELVCLYPFTSTSSPTQRKIKQQYDQLVKCNESNGLTLAQVGEFANCLIEARNELQHKSEVIKRRFTITKALLFKADRSSIDRHCQQIYKLELEQKRLEEDAFVYNWLQQQLKVSPAYKKMLELSACMELKAKSGELIEHKENEFADISFEELLAQEKKDVFWQKNGKLRTQSS